MAVTRRNRSARDQMDQLLSYMERHSEFAKSHIPNLGAAGSDKYKQMWTVLTESLNQNGPIQKDSAGWVKTWKYMKASAKKKKAEFTVAMNETGNNGPVEPLSDFDERISAIFGRYGTGLSIVPEIGVIKNTIPYPQTDSCKYTSTSSEDDANSDAEMHPIQWSKWAVLSVIIERICPQINDIIQDFEACVCEVLWREKRKPIRNRVNDEQKQIMLRFMEKHRSFSQNQGDPKVNDRLWQALAERLNGKGATIRDVKSWQKSWGDLQRSIDKRKASLKPGKHLQRDDVRVLSLRDPQQSSLDTEVRHRTQSRSPARLSSLPASHSYPSTRHSRSPSSPVAPTHTSRYRSRSPVSRSSSRFSGSHPLVHGSSFQTSGSRPPIRRSNSQASGSHSPIHGSSFQTSGSRPSVRRLNSQASGSHPPIHGSSFQTSGSRPSVRRLNSQASGSHPPIHGSSFQTSGSRPSVRRLNSQASGSHPPVHGSSFQTSGPPRPPVRHSNSQASGSHLSCQKKTKSVTRPLHIDLTEEPQSNDKVNLPRRFTCEKQTAVHSTGQNTTAVITAMEENAACLQEAVDRLITVLECQNNILSKGFQSIGRKLKSAMLTTVGNSLDEHSGVDEESKADGVHKIDEEYKDEVVTENPEVDAIGEADEYGEVEENRRIVPEIDEYYKDETVTANHNVDAIAEEGDENQRFMDAEYMFDVDNRDCELNYDDIVDGEEYLEDMTHGGSP